MTTEAQEMPRYKCHKEVHALKIVDIKFGTTESLWLQFDDHEQVHVGHLWKNKHKPEVGGYYVVYADGYASFSPAEAFAAGYTRIV